MTQPTLALARPKIVLRDYQLEAISVLRQQIRQGDRRQVLCMGTGSGKTVLAAWMTEQAASRGKCVVFLVDRLALVDQTSKVFAEAGIGHGIIQGKSTRGVDEPVRIASAQTLEKRRMELDADLVIVDECHDQRKRILRLLADHDGVAVGLSATPFSAGMGQHWDTVVQVTTTEELVGRGWLVPLRVYAGREPDMTGARTSAGEWLAGEVERRGRVVIGDVLETWEKRTHQHFGGPVKTLAFSATVSHGADICEQFQEAGHDFRQISWLDRDMDNRRKLIEDFRAGKIMGLVSCEALAKGFDVPDVQCLICARSYRRSLAAHIQQVGRGMRPSPDKKFCLVLDHSGNWVRFLDETSHFFRHGIDELDPGIKSRKKAAKKRQPRRDRVCKCGLVIPLGETLCSCGREKPRREDWQVVDGKLVASNAASRWADPKLAEHVWTQCCRLAQDRKQPDMEAAGRAAKAYYRSLTGRWPRWGEPFQPATYLDQAVAGWLRRSWRAEARRRETEHLNRSTP